jgi:hypothetical protein
MPAGFRQKLGALVLDWPRYEMHMRRNWIRICNRAERLEIAPDGSGVRCNWKWASDLHLAKVFPRTGARLMGRALQDWPIQFVDHPPATTNQPQVSFVIGHRGLARLPHLLATLRTIAAQQDVNCECIVVEQSDQDEIASRLPAWVRYVHTRPPRTGMPYCRAWTLNVGARHAKGDLLVLHDNDILVPQTYATALWQRHKEGFEVINLKRFIFYLDQTETNRLFSVNRLFPALRTEKVMQNAEGGGSIAVGRGAYMAIGGFDESFLGWGGEDNEFWERALTRKVWPYGNLPFLHLWHPAQPRKAAADNPTATHYQERSKIDPALRIRELAARPFGREDALSGPTPELPSRESLTRCAE